MPVTLLDRLPLPNLKAYTAGSALLLSVAVYYALSVTSDPSWRVNATLQRQEPTEPGGEGEVIMASAPAVPPVPTNGTRLFSEQFADVITFMMQDPLCMWTLINIAYCALAVFGFVIQRLVFGPLRVSEAQRMKDKFWNYVFYKFIFVFGVINVQYMDEVLLWCSWFTLVGFLHLLGQLCKDRFEYLLSSPRPGRAGHVRLAALLGAIVGGALALLAAAGLWGLPAGRDTFAFMAAECVLVLLFTLHVAVRYGMELYEVDVVGLVSYYTHLVFDSVCLVVELLHVVHMVVYSNMLVSMPSLVLLMQLRHLLHELQARVRRHRLYTSLATHMSRNYPMASKEEVEKNQDNCAICWEPMKEARKLPCSHLFHNSCLCLWVQQDASCPTCRRALAAGPPPPAPAPARPAGPPTPAPAAHAAPRAPRQPNHLFHFDGSRYVSWLPSFSVEVTRVPRAAPPRAGRLVAQVQGVFPSLPGAARADLRLSAHGPPHAVLESRLPPETMPAPTPEPPQPARVTVTSVASDTGNLLEDDHRPQFAGSASEREHALRRRKQALCARARAAYLRAHAPAPAPAPSSTSGPAPAPAPAPSSTSGPAPAPRPPPPRAPPTSLPAAFAETLPQAHGHRS